MAWSIVNVHRRVLAMESGARVKDWGGRVSVALLFPNTYHAGMSNLGFQAMYGLFNDCPEVVCERVFLPDADLAREYARTGTPLLSLENQKPVNQFELMACSLSYENDYHNVLSMLTLGRLARRRDQRLETDPLVIAGGVAMRSNPEPLADFLDLVLIGDGEVIVPPLIRAWCDVRSEPLPKKERVLHLARNVPGAYAPAWYEATFDPKGRLVSFHPKHHQVPAKVHVARISDLPRPALTTQVLTPNTEFAQTRLVEVGRGCPHGCRFCLAGFVYRPPRHQARTTIVDTLGAPQKEGERIGLVGPSVADFPEIEPLVQELISQGREVTVSSLRSEALTPGLIQALSRGRLKGAAMAPEAGSQRLRDFINKRLTEAQILQGAETMAEAGLNKIKLYFMVGLPTETMDDLQALVDLVHKITGRLNHTARIRKRLTEAVISLGSFVPKPFTPLAGQPMASPVDLTAKTNFVKNGLKRLGGVKVQYDAPRSTWLQTLLARGHRETGAVLEALADGAGLKTIMQQADPRFNQLVTGDLSETTVHPWSFIDYGFRSDFFGSDLELAHRGLSTPPCRPETCRTCGVCTPNRVNSAAQVPGGGL